MRYGFPDAFWLLALVALLGVATAAALLRRRQHLARLGDPDLVERLTASLSGTRLAIRRVLLVTGLALLCLAAARPQMGGTSVKTKTSGIDVVFALDISKSMLAKDVLPSRLQAARLLLEGLMQRMGTDRAALVPFAGVAFAQCPLTRDLSAISVYLRALDPESIPVGGTAVGRALTVAVELLSGDGKRAQERVVVLITDGEDHDSDPAAAAAKAAEAGIKVFTVGMGSVAGEPIPLYHSDGSLQGYVKDRAGQFVYSRLDEAGLQAMADKTGGIYLPYQGDGTLRALSAALGKLQQTELESSVRRQFDERFQYALGPALLLLALEALLGNRRRQS